MPESKLETLIARRAEFRRALLRWYRREARRLPWREVRSPYRTVVSEFMLQQTRVSTAVPYFERWMARLPDWRSLAAASEATVLKCWEGLGYYARVRRLRSLAQQVLTLPSLPRTREDWLEMPGVGPYTAAAIASIAFDDPAACVDGNVVRILSRLVSDGTRRRDSSSAAKAFQGTAEQLLSRSAPGDHNQAMMELGATVCLRSVPRCGVCPVAGFCAAFRMGRAADYPRLLTRPMETAEVTRVWCERRGALLLHRASEADLRLAGQHELPTAVQAGFNPARIARAPVLAVRKRGITRFRITESIHSMAPPRVRPGRGLVWMPLAKLDSVVLSGPHKRWIGEILRKGNALSRRKLTPADALTPGPPQRPRAG
jgi:A/G-specific adenine glycosylase